ncbi:MAG: hypothetical protein KKA07_03475 [Bacteroidetes bacterium]|nr:hypothetical protein [Bacteroidota bacterium]MBU1718113.1 hypothetical protein [Bacteroidota bacterium]
MKKILLLSTLISVFYYTTSNGQNVQSEEIKIKVENPENTCISITNTSDTVVAFTFSLNGMFFQATAEVADEVRRMAGKSTDSLFFYAWKFIFEHTSGNYSLMNDNSATSLLLHLNSIGMGYCGKQALSLAQLWEELGYETRIWDLNGHIVPEVQKDGKWMMLDPTYRVYYFSEQGEIASVEELAADPTPIVQPKKLITSDVRYFLRYTKAVAKFYITTEDNTLLYTNGYPEGIDTLFVELPPHSSFTFPGIFSNLSSRKEKDQEHFAQCKLRIPAPWQGVVTHSLFLAQVKGSGTMQYNNKIYEVNDTYLVEHLLLRKNFFAESNVSVESDTMDLIFFMNPYFSRILPENTLVISGENIEALKVSTTSISNAESTPKHLRELYFSYSNRRAGLIGEEFAGKNCIPITSFNTIEEFILFVQSYFNCVYKGTEKDKAIRQIAKVKGALTQLPEAFPVDRLLYFLKNIPAYLILYDLDHASVEEIQDALQAMAAKK